MPQSLRRVVVCLAVLSVGGCHWRGNEFRQPARATRLMAMAAEEAGQVDKPAGRLKRQLNIAEMQVDHDRLVDGRDTLRQARQTLEQAKGGELDELTRLAGWVSLSELARSAKDKPFAMEACEKAIALLRAVQPEAQRCEYVRSVAAEVRHLQGKPAAAELLAESADWAGKIESEEYRRKAYAAIASDLFLYDAYAPGQAVLKRDEDPAWRADTLAGLARNAIPMSGFGKLANYQVFSSGSVSGVR